MLCKSDVQSQSKSLYKYIWGHCMTCMEKSIAEAVSTPRETLPETVPAAWLRKNGQLEL